MRIAHYICAGTTTDGEFASLRSLGDTGSIHLWQLIKDSRLAVSRMKKEQLENLLFPVGGRKLQVIFENIPNSSWAFLTQVFEKLLIPWASMNVTMNMTSIYFLSVVTEEGNLVMAAQHAAIPPETILYIFEQQQAGLTREECVGLLRQSLVPQGVQPYPFR